MYARAVDEAARRLRDLRQDEWLDLGLGALAFGLAVAATELYPPLALPLFVGGVAASCLGVRALWLRWDLVDRLAAERDAHSIAEVRAYAAREASPDRRRAFAAGIRARLADPRLAAGLGQAATTELQSLARELEDAGLALDPVSAVVCARLVDDAGPGGLLQPDVRGQELCARVRAVRSGFSALRPPERRASAAREAG
jgi:hypothetical protein